MELWWDSDILSRLQGICFENFVLSQICYTNSVSVVKLKRVTNFTASLMTFSANPLTTDDDYPGCDMRDCPHRHYW